MSWGFLCHAGHSECHFYTFDDDGQQADGVKQVCGGGAAAESDACHGDDGYQDEGGIEYVAYEEQPGWASSAFGFTLGVL